MVKRTRIKTVRDGKDTITYIQEEQPPWWMRPAKHNPWWFNWLFFLFLITIWTVYFGIVMGNALLFLLGSIIWISLFVAGFIKAALGGKN